MVLDYLSQIEGKDFDLSMNLFFPNSGYNASFDIQTANMSDTMRGLLTDELVKALADKPFTATDYIVDVHLSSPKTGDENEKYQFWAYSSHLPVSKEIAETIFPSLCEEANAAENGYGNYDIFVS
jgi:hypothetical protein